MLSFFILIIDLCSLIAVVIAHILYPITELVIPIGVPSKGAKTDIEI